MPRTLAMGAFFIGSTTRAVIKDRLIITPFSFA